ncbi:hypothetical protein FRC12_012272 [Ceratobasidium sp. 428]|nr:hypothetical protein FRC12_012272 [Ceratobasidium sp. 428]
MEAFTQWKTAQLHLENAAQLFLDTSVNLRAELSLHVISPKRNSPLEELIDKIQSQFTLNHLAETKLATIRAVVMSMRNISPTFVPINTLPPEIFSRIFLLTIASTHLYKKFKRPDPLLAISAVCTRWRQLAIGTRSLWSHIELPTLAARKNGVSDQIEATRLWLERSRGAPLYIHVELGPRFDHRNISPLLASLQPYTAYIYSLTFINTAENIVNTFLESSRNGASGSLKCLAIDDCPSPSYAPGTQQSQPTVYPQGLLHLQLWKTKLGFEELTTVLSGSQLLQTLRLHSMVITQGKITAISLPRLQLLDVIDLESRGLFALLLALFPGRLELDFRLTLGQLSHQGLTNAVVQFCRRANVISLYLSESTSVPSAHVALLLSSVPLMRVLVLKDLSDYFPALDSVTAAIHGRHVARCPKLRTLCLLGNEEMSRDAVVRVKRVVEAYTLGTIILDNCKLAWDIDKDPNYPRDTRKNIEADFWQCLSKQVKNIITHEFIPDKDSYIRRLILESREA